MLVAVWIALGVAVAAVAAGFAAVVLRAFGAWRTFRGLLQASSDALGELERRAADTERKVGVLVERGAELPDAAARLDASLQTFGVLRSAAGETSARARLIRGLVPRK